MKRILVAPLDWGLGHATRCIPIIRELLKQTCTVFIGGTGDSLSLLKNEFPQLTFLSLPGYHPVYPVKGSMLWKLGIQVPKFLRVIKKEHRQIELIIQLHNIDMIISDNRYGCWSPRIPSIFITHQLNILMPKGFGWLSKIVGLCNKKLISNFSFCWIPDYEDNEKRLSGDLSLLGSPALKNVFFIGPLSRFHPVGECVTKYDVVCIFSGPEPQRSIFEKKVVEQLKKSDLRYLIVRGVFSQHVSSQNEVPFLNSEALQAVMSKTSLVIARSGYSTMMDLAALGKKCILVPTPGQTEQEYLAKRWMDRGVCYSIAQEHFNLDKALKESELYTGFKLDTNQSRTPFVQVLKKILTKI